MSAKRNTVFAPRYVQAAFDSDGKIASIERDPKGRMIAKGTLKSGLKIGDEVHLDFVMREALTGDIIDAEAHADASKPLTFSVALLAQQLVRLGTFEGPFTSGLLCGLKSTDLGRLREAQAEIDIVGEL